LNTKLEQDLRLLKKCHDEQFEQHIQTTASTVDQLQTEIRTLKRLCEEKTDQVSLFLHPSILKPSNQSRIEVHLFQPP